MKTSATFPVAQGTTIMLKCLKKRHVLFGDREVTCDKGTEYKDIQNAPHYCKLARKIS